MAYFSIIIPVFNRPDEVDELLQSLTLQRQQDFEVVVVEDGSTVSCRHVVEKYNSQLAISYHVIPNGGPGGARNRGVEWASGEYVVIFDSDCIIPPDYFTQLKELLEREQIDAYGGPDRAHADFTTTQKAINYAMTSFFTTGGIRGGSKRLDRFYPRSFNMGVRRRVYQQLGGFSKMRFGEDIDFSIRIIRGGFATRLIDEAWVFHKRRNTFRTFFKQVYNSGIARINLYKKYPSSLKAVHCLPALFVVGVIFLCFAALACVYALLPLGLFCAVVGIDSSLRNRSLCVGLCSIPASFVQLFGYGSGFLYAMWRRVVLGKSEFEAFTNSFYK